MAYEKTVWVNGQAPALDAEHLNKMEQGIADAVSVTPQTLTDEQKAQARGNINSAPGGHGLGDTTIPEAPDNDANKIATTGWYVASVNVPTVGWWLISSITYGAVKYQFAYANENASGILNGTALQRSKKGASVDWTPWEWVNPPMILGTEYRTTERYLGKPVYVKLVDCGTVPAQGTYKDFVFSPDVNSVVSISAYSPQRGTTLPYYDANGVRYSITSHGAAVTIWNYSESLLDTDVRALIKYTKTTD